MKQHLSHKPYFVILIALFYLLHLINESYPMLTAADLFLPVSLWITGLSTALFITIILFGKKRSKYALFVLYLQSAFLLFGAFHDFLKNLAPSIARYVYLLPLLLLIGIVLCFSLVKSNHVYPRLFIYLNTLGMVLVSIELVRCITVGITDGNARFWFASNENNTEAINEKCDTCIKPDIYYILFDEYAASRTLKAYWGYDNHRLDSFFRQNGFYYAYHARSNYNFTSFSVGSILNMGYHPQRMDQKIDLPLFCKGIATVERNRVCDILIKNNYRIINQSYFNLPGSKTPFGVSFLVNKKEALLSQTLWGKAKADIGWHFSFFRNPGHTQEQVEQRKLQLSLVKKTYNLLLETSTRTHEQPIFVYSHFFLPHQPYYYDSTGTVRPTDDWFIAGERKELYLSQLKYTNTLMMDIVTRLKSAGNRPRVIIIQSDHGYRSFSNKPLIEGINNTSFEFNNLNAIYFPDGNYTGLYDSITSVNTFRVVLNKYLDLQMPLLKDSTIYIRKK